MVPDEQTHAEPVGLAGELFEHLDLLLALGGGVLPVLTQFVPATVVDIGVQLAVVVPPHEHERVDAILWRPG